MQETLNNIKAVMDYLNGLLIKTEGYDAINRSYFKKELKKLEKMYERILKV